MTTMSWSSRVVAGWISHHNHFSTTGVASGSAKKSRNRPTEFVPLRDTFSERRSLWKTEMTAMRKVWTAEHEQRLAEKAAREAEQRRLIEIAKAELRRVKAIRKAEKAIVHNALVKREREAAKQILVKKAQRRAQLEFTDHLRQIAREQELLAASCSWVTREDLDEQIEYALKHPVMMW